MIYLLKIKQVLHSKMINREQLEYKASKELQNLYINSRFKNENEKYLRQKNNKIEKIEDSGVDPDIYKTYEEISAEKSEKEKNGVSSLKEKYAIGGEIHKELKKKFRHLDFTDYDYKIILDDMKEDEIKSYDLKDIYNMEKKRAEYIQKKAELNINKKEGKKLNKSK